MMISVIVPVHNVPRDLLTPCLDSLEMQTLRKDEYEIIIVDDCSTESETIEGIGEFAEHVSNAKIVRHAKNLGLNEARWSGVKTSIGEYVVFVDGDDPIVRDGLENLRFEAARVEADMVTAPMLRWHPLTKTYSNIPTTDQALPGDYIKRLQVILSGESTFSMCGRLFRRGLLTDDVFALPIGQIHEDVTTFPRIAFQAKTVVHCAKPFYLYTLNFSSLTTQFSEKHPDGIIYGLRDWIENARSRGLLDELSEAISRGAEKLVNVCVMERCFFSANLSERGKAEVLRAFREEYLSLSLPRIDLSAPAVRFLVEADQEVFTGDPDRLSKELATIFPYAAPSQLKPDQILKFGMGPSEMAQRLKDKVVIIGQVDYQVRNSVTFARELTRRGHTCVVLDNSGFVAGGKRPFPLGEEHIFDRTEHVRVKTGPYPVDWLSTAKLVVVFNDFNEDFREALEFRHRLELPSACAVEGINDFLRSDFEGYNTLPYRRCGHVFLAGEHDRRYFADRNTHVIGLPIIEELSKKEVRFPSENLAVLNVNFTYGVLERARDEFVQKAKHAFDAVGLSWEMTQHPMDKGKFDDLPVSDKSQYQLIDECTVFVSRFATGILEALANGKPAIYFNPHQEKVEKFKEPLGAFEIANTEQELVQALRKVLIDVEEGVDFRDRAKEFLKNHAGYDPAGLESGARFASAATEVMDSHPDAHEEVSELFHELAKMHGLLENADGQRGLIIGEFFYNSKAQLDETELVYRYFGGRGKRMVHVGASPISSSERNLGNNWEVLSLKPDLNNRLIVSGHWMDHGHLSAKDTVGSGETAKRAELIADSDSIGASVRFAPEGKINGVGKTETSALADGLSLGGVKYADFLKIELEGDGQFVLDELPQRFGSPEVVLAELSNVKTLRLGHTTQDLANVLVEQGYSVYVSEWIPIVDGDASRSWRRMLRYSPDLELSGTWGNVVGFRKDPGEKAVIRLAKQTLKFDAKPESLGVMGPSAPKGWSDEVIDTLILELDRLWVLSLVQERKAGQSLLSRGRIPAVGSDTPLSELALIARRFGIAISTPISFDEESYLLTYPDIAAAIEDGQFVSGYEHYVLHGHVESGRQRATIS